MKRLALTAVLFVLAVGSMAVAAKKVPPWFRFKLRDWLQRRTGRQTARNAQVSPGRLLRKLFVLPPSRVPERRSRRGRRRPQTRPGP